MITDRLCVFDGFLQEEKPAEDENANAKEASANDDEARK